MRGIVLVLRVQLRDEDGRLEADGAHTRAVLEVPEDALPVLAGAEQEAVVGGPAQGLDLARVAAQLAGDAVGLHVEDHDDAIVLRVLLSAHCSGEREIEGSVPVRRRAGRRGG